MNRFMENFGERLMEAIRQKEIGETFTLIELGEELWAEISREIGAKPAGRMFGQAVDAGRFPMVERAGIRAAGRANQYIRL